MGIYLTIYHGVVNLDVAIYFDVFAGGVGMGFGKFKSLYRQGLCFSLGMMAGFLVKVPNSLAAEKVTINFGPFQQTVRISEIESYAKTGRLSNSLQIFAPFLNSEIRSLLNQQVNINPQVADRFLDEAMETSQGKQLLARLGQAIPGSNKETIQAAVSLMIRQVNGASVLGFLRAYPGENITIDVAKAVEVGLALNPENLKSQAFGLLLKRDLGENINQNIPSNIHPGKRGKYPVKIETINFRRGNRQIIADIYTGDRQTQQPLAIISHGFGANRLFLKYLGEHLASHGITTVSIEHPGSNARAINQAANGANLANLMSARELIERPQDVSGLLDELQRRHQQNGNPNFNTDNTVVIGHSLGGYTALALAGGELNIGELRKFCQRDLGLTVSPGDWLQCAGASLPPTQIKLRDRRVKQVVALNPLVGKLFGRQGLTKINIPVLIVAGTEDAITPAVSHQLEPFRQLGGKKYLVAAIGGTHLSLSDSAYRISSRNVIYERRGAQVQGLKQLVRGMGLAFVKQLTTEAQMYKPFLSASYAQSLSTPEIPLKFASQLPENVQYWLDFVTK